MPASKHSDGESQSSSRSTFDTLTADAGDLLDLIERREAEDFGSAIAANESEEARTIRELALKHIFAFLTDRNDARVANLRVSKRDTHMKLSMSFEPRDQEQERVVIAPDPNCSRRLNLYDPSKTPISTSESLASRASTPSTSQGISKASEIQTARLIPEGFAKSLCDRLTALVIKQEVQKK
ncbi:hypothetical protein QR680_008747 [Steinernema hermaphroditum]|uniref:Uncharacterized protein n=1 Tax=Steinernema hermaphroditum TaxID=289476 RepID=A0AA39IJQ1_9BILA|nr:hypothetical protein QR680_008747 [Steinernema hermaphroditum]